MKYSVIIFLFPAVILAGPAYDELVKELPKDVVQIIDRRIGCNYWNGEIPKDANSAEGRASGRPQMIEKKLKELKCSRLERDEASAKVKYKTKKNILEALEEAKSLTPAD